MSVKLNSALDRLSEEIDPAAFEKRRFEREEGASLKHAVEIAAEALKLSDFGAIPFEQFGIPGTGVVVRHEASDEMIGFLHFEIDQRGLRVWMDPKGNFSCERLGQPSLVSSEHLHDDRVLDAVGEQIERVQFLGR